jgi:uncharacterized protein YjiS (DUF1127 family)
MSPAPQAAANSLRRGRRPSCLIRKAWRAYSERRGRRATIAALQALSDRALYDIGITRSQIESIVHGSRDHRRCYDPASQRRHGGG